MNDSRNFVGTKNYDCATAAKLLYRTTGVLALESCYHRTILVLNIKRRDDYVMRTDGKYGGKELFTFEDIFNSTFTPKTFDVQWIRLSGQCDDLTVCYVHQMK